MPNQMRCDLLQFVAILAIDIVQTKHLGFLAFIVISICSWLLVVCRSSSVSQSVKPVPTISWDVTVKQIQLALQFFLLCSCGRFGGLFAQHLICFFSARQIAQRSSCCILLHFFSLHVFARAWLYRPSRHSVHFEDEAPVDDASAAVP